MKIDIKINDNRFMKAMRLRFPLVETVKSGCFDCGVWMDLTSVQKGDGTDTLYCYRCLSARIKFELQDKTQENIEMLMEHWLDEDHIHQPF